MKKVGKAKGVLPNGKKIKDLREKAGLTQEALVHGASIDLRTYQRAEQGKPVLPQMLQQIALLLKTDSRALMIEKDQAPKERELFRLQCVSENGASKFFGELQSLLDKVEYKFELSPTLEDAEQVAALVEYCEELAITDIDEIELKLLRPADKIRAIGKLNDMLTALISKKIYVFSGKYNLWGVRSVKMMCFDAGEFRASFPSLSTHLRVVIQDSAVLPYLNETYSSFGTKENAYKRAIDANINEGLKPEWIESDAEEAFMWDDFLAEYRIQYERRLGTQTSPLQLAKSSKP